MTTDPNFELSRLRQIGWDRWDPIGLGSFEGNADDEYDSYLLQAAGRLWNGSGEADVANYLVSIETEYMGLSDGPEIRPRAREVVKALSNYVAELRG